MRHAPTASEAALWCLLSGRKLGVAFRRQVPLDGRYVADFFAPSARLVVEVDSASHVGRATSDARRDRILARLGYRVLRLDASLVLHTTRSLSPASKPRSRAAKARSVTAMTATLTEARATCHAFAWSLGSGLTLCGGREASVTHCGSRQ